MKKWVMMLVFSVVSTSIGACRAEAEALRGAARLEDLSVWVMESCARIDKESALQKARVMKAEALGVKI